ncbi:MAG: hypothetical protein JWL65_7033 [Gammaproteobacteria bacterium]|nr:hypothetical protein [Gammaproteobacteria bacterium]
MTPTARFLHTMFRIELVEVSPWQRCADTVIARWPEELGCVGSVCSPRANRGAARNRDLKSPPQPLIAGDCWAFVVSARASAASLVPSTRCTFPSHQAASTKPAATCRSVSSNSSWTGHEWQWRTHSCRPTESFQVHKAARNAPAAGVERSHAKVLTQMKPTSRLLRSARRTSGQLHGLEPDGRHAPITVQRVVTDCRHRPTRVSDWGLMPRGRMAAD